MDEENSEESGAKSLAFYAAYGHSIMAWNSAEHHVRGLLSSLIGREMNSTLGTALTSELGSRGLYDAIKSLAHDVYDPPISEDIEYVAQFYERLLPHRNYLVHAPLNFWEGTGALVDGWSAKGKIRRHLDTFDLPDVERFRDWCWELSNFAVGLQFNMFFPVRIPGKPLTWPQRPPLPDTLKRNSQIWRELLRPPPSSAP